MDHHAASHISDRDGRSSIVHAVLQDAYYRQPGLDAQTLWNKGGVSRRLAIQVSRNLQRTHQVGLSTRLSIIVTAMLEEQMVFMHATHDGR